MNLPVYALLIVNASFSIVRGQNQTFDLGAMVRNHGLSVSNRTVSAIRDGQISALRFSAHEGDGVAWIDGISFSDGTVELDIRGKNVLQQSFVGLAFHGNSPDSLEAIYFRPFNFESADSVRHAHAVEYVFEPDFPWERLRREHPGVYEQPIKNAPDPDQWFHVTIRIVYPQVSVYVNHDKTPCIEVKELSTRQRGKIGLWVGNNSDGDFANLQISAN
jgi:hypothetical protein